MFATRLLKFRPLCTNPNVQKLATAVLPQEAQGKYCNILTWCLLIIIIFSTQPQKH